MNIGYINIIILILLSYGSLLAQTDSLVNEYINAQKQNEKIYWEVDEAAVFQNGSIDDYLKENYIYSPIIKEEGIAGTLVVKFTVNQDGSVSNITTTYGFSAAQKEEAIRVIRSTSGKWKAAKKNRSNVASYQTTFIEFSLLEYKPYKIIDTLHTDELAYFTEGKFDAYVMENYKITEAMSRRWRYGVILVGFTVEIDGTLSNVKVIYGKGLSPLQDQEAIRVIQSTSGKWIPGKIDGKPVRTTFKQKLTFTK